jgi:hypothetical protein
MSQDLSATVPRHLKGRSWNVDGDIRTRFCSNKTSGCHESNCSNELVSIIKKSRTGGETYNMRRTMGRVAQYWRDSRADVQ